MNLVIAGGSGLLALNWAYQMKERHSITLFTHTKCVDTEGVESKCINLDSPENIYSALKSTGADVVVNTVAVTNVDLCEESPVLAKHVNAEIAENIAIAAENLDIKLVHISSDQIFSGDKEYYSEGDTPSPINVYGKTKLLAENIVNRLSPNAMIVRTNFYGWGYGERQSFSDWVINSLEKELTIQMFDDVYYTPIIIDELVDVIHALLDNDYAGIVNIGGRKKLSKYAFGMLISDVFGMENKYIQKAFLDINKFKAQRPRDMSLSITKVESILGYEVGNISRGIEVLYQQYVSGAKEAFQCNVTVA